ncbi:hypothetical protein FRB90_002388, partial [Tulasnella sp. 427]
VKSGRTTAWGCSVSPCSPRLGLLHCRFRRGSFCWRRSAVVRATRYSCTTKLVKLAGKAPLDVRGGTRRLKRGGWGG